MTAEADLPATGEHAGLRDRKKAATRTALANAAVRLVRASGIEAVTAEMIAAEAGVSTRTFHNYFSSKEEAVLHYFENYVRDWVDEFRARPADEPIWDSIEAVVVDVVTDPDRPLEETVEMLGMCEFNPTLLAKQVETNSRVSRMLGEVIAERTGTNPDTDLYPTLVHTAVGGACKSALDLWMSGRSTASGPEELVRDALRQIRSGLPEP
ncbi:putative TetR family transcriptional regulator [Rhodococcus rhodnii LMG 5362]|uniref:Putative TetR family transcriptional regulator n=1 Tax=Rhodococcus rhodnii LMG 5362 TaxID=1273125 RepID=R7WHI4_9NOCA|nr:TetR/AcrR family transcriptional regulator [Rhodococcus rhodnii]EOM74576.1 putative TetR family transcriptional regulator [Rhodococcus rhodnii LMG 5362]